MREHTSTDLAEQYRIRSGLLLAIGGTALFALKSIFIKLAYQQGVDTMTLLTLRMLIAVPFYLLMLWWLIRKPETVPPRPDQLLAVLGLGFLGYYLASWLDMTGLNFITAQLERLTLYSYPVMTALLSAFFLRERITRRILLALLLTYAGVVLLYWRESTGTGNHTDLGVLLVLGSALSYSCYVVFSKGLIFALGSRLFTSIAMLASTLYVIAHFLATREIDDLLVNRSAWAYAFLLAFVSTVLPSFIVSEAIARLGATRTGITGTVGPVFTILLAVWLLGEPFGWIQLAGVLLVLSGVRQLGQRDIR